jgi:hypothetical protein
MMNSDQTILHALIRQELPVFIEKTFKTLLPGQKYFPNWHLDAIAYHLMLCYLGEIRRLIITMPPRSLKSISASVAFPAWVLGLQPGSRIVCVSYANDLAMKHALDCRTVMASPWYRDAFLRTRLHPEKNSIGEFMTTRQGYRLSTSVGGTLTGRGGNLVIIDDPHKADEANSDIRREATKEWFRSTLVSRLDNKKEDRIIVIQQRLHEDDLAGTLLESGDWVHLNLRAIAEEDESILIGKNKYYNRSNYSDNKIEKSA